LPGRQRWTRERRRDHGKPIDEEKRGEESGRQ